jgi:hypothetical protein
MSPLLSKSQELLSGPRDEHWWQGSRPARRTESFEPSQRLLFAGLVVLGLGCLAWYYVGPDVWRYMRIRNM